MRRHNNMRLIIYQNLRTN